MAAKKTEKSKVNFFVDLVIGVGFVVVTVSGLVLLFAGPAGFQGGRNPHAVQEVLFLSRWTWRSLHDWSGIAIIAGVVLHLALHWRWVVCMTRNLFRRGKPARNATLPSQPPVSQPIEG